MLAKLFSYSLLGIDAKPVEVEVDISPASLPRVVLVGMAETAVKESTHRVERALVNWAIPARLIVSSSICRPLNFRRTVRHSICQLRWASSSHAGNSRAIG